MASASDIPDASMLLGVVNTASSETPVSYDNKFVKLAKTGFPQQIDPLEDMDCGFAGYHLLYSRDFPQSEQT
jgi:hypothetical protein